MTFKILKPETDSDAKPSISGKYTTRVNESQCRIISYDRNFKGVRIYHSQLVGISS